MSPFVSVIINYHNAQEYLEKSILSVLNQTFSNWEIILFDNFSDDKSLFNISKYLNNKNIRYYRSDKFLSLGEARNLALDKAKSDFIAILDSDDLMSPERLEKQVKYLISNKLIFLVSSWVNIIDHEDKIISKYNPNYSEDEIYQRMAWENPIVHSSVMFRKEINNKKVEYNKSIYYAQDYDFYLSYIKKDNFKILEDYLCSNRSHDNNLTKSKEYYEIICLEQIMHLQKAKKLNLNENSIKKNLLSINLNYLKLLIYYLSLFKFKKSLKYLTKLNVNIFKILLHIGPVRRYFGN